MLHYFCHLLQKLNCLEKSVFVFAQVQNSALGIRIRKIIILSSTTTSVSIEYRVNICSPGRLIAWVQSKYGLESSNQSAWAACLWTDLAETWWTFHHALNQNPTTVSDKSVHWQPRKDASGSTFKGKLWKPKYGPARSSVLAGNYIPCLLVVAEF